MLEAPPEQSQASGRYAHLTYSLLLGTFFHNGFSQQAIAREVYKHTESMSSIPSPPSFLVSVQWINPPSQR